MTRYDSVLTPAPVVAWCPCGEPYSAHLSECPECRARKVGMGMLTQEEQAALYQRNAYRIERLHGRTA